MDDPFKDISLDKDFSEYGDKERHELLVKYAKDVQYEESFDFYVNKIYIGLQKKFDKKHIERAIMSDNEKHHRDTEKSLEETAIDIFVKNGGNESFFGFMIPMEVTTKWQMGHDREMKELSDALKRGEISKDKYKQLYEELYTFWDGWHTNFFELFYHFEKMLSNGWLSVEQYLKITEDFYYVHLETLQTTPRFSDSKFEETVWPGGKLPNSDGLKRFYEFELDSELLEAVRKFTNSVKD